MPAAGREFDPRKVNLSEALQPGVLCFRCNLCGEISLVPAEELGRELQSCSSCSSTSRERAIIRALSLGLFAEVLALPDFPLRRDLRGFGMSDSGRYAARLAEKLDYENTFYHKEPRVDVGVEVVPPHLIEKADFIISSEVFEHVLPPVARAFENVYKMLKPGGLFVLTVPYGLHPKTIEHFPDLHDFTLIERPGASPNLRNVTREGEVQEFDNVVMHIGDGATLEMRVFAEADLLQHLTIAGFEAIHVHRTPDFRHGVWWPEPCSLPITARKPA